MPEKSMVWEYVILPVLGWVGYQQRTKVDQKTCDKVHLALCNKLDMIHKDLKDDIGYVRDKLDKHLGEQR